MQGFPRENVNADDLAASFINCKNVFKQLGIELYPGSCLDKRTPHLVKMRHGHWSDSTLRQFIVAMTPIYGVPEFYKRLGAGIGDRPVTDGELEVFRTILHYQPIYTEIKTGKTVFWNEAKPDHYRISTGIDPMFTDIKFHSGNPYVLGFNGVFIEDMLMLAMHRVSTQNEKLHSPFNIEAIEHISKAMMALNARTSKRVEGGEHGKAYPRGLNVGVTMVDDAPFQGV